MTTTSPPIRSVVLDYGGTLTSATAAIEPHLGMRPVDPAAVPALHLLHRQGMRLLIASNTLPHQNRRLALRQARIEELFTDVLMSHELGVAKPEPDFYDAVLRAADCPPEQVLFVGNNISHDVHGPLRHGMRAVHVRPDTSVADDELPAGAYVIGHVSDLPELVVALCS
jgi:FMN phosphatase YigB (HAD superfamily)